VLADRVLKLHSVHASFASFLISAKACMRPRQLTVASGCAEVVAMEFEHADTTYISCLS